MSGEPIVAGIGFRAAAEAGAIRALVERALAEAGIPENRLAALATVADRAAAPALRAAAGSLGVPVLGIGPVDLAAADPRVATRSPRIAELRGVGSLAEAAALAAGGPESRLVLARITDGSATCALAGPASRRSGALHDPSGTVCPPA